MDDRNDCWLLTSMVIFVLVCIGCGCIFVYFFYLMMAKLLGAFFGAIVGAFVAGYHLFAH